MATPPAEIEAKVTAILKARSRCEEHSFGEYDPECGLCRARFDGLPEWARVLEQQVQERMVAGGGDEAEKQAPSVPRLITEAQVKALIAEALSLQAPLDLQQQAQRRHALRNDLLLLCAQTYQCKQMDLPEMEQFLRAEFRILKREYDQLSLVQEVAESGGLDNVTHFPGA